MVDMEQVELLTDALSGLNDQPDEIVHLSAELEDNPDSFIEKFGRLKIEREEAAAVLPGR